MRHDAYRDARTRARVLVMLATHAVGTPYHLLILALGRCRPWAPVAPLSDNVSVARSVHGRSPVLRNVIRMNAASRPRGVVRHDKQLTPNSSIRRSRRASPARAGGEQSRMMRAHQIPERVQTATQELSHQALRRHTRKPATWP